MWTVNEKCKDFTETEGVVKVKIYKDQAPNFKYLYAFFFLLVEEWFQKTENIHVIRKKLSNAKNLKAREANRNRVN